MPERRPQSSSIICSPSPNFFWSIYSDTHYVAWNKNAPVFDNVTTLQLQFNYRFPPDNLTETNMITYVGIDKNASLFQVETAQWPLPDAIRDRTTPCTLNIMMDGSSAPLSSVNFSIIADHVVEKGDPLSRGAVIAICVIVPAFFLILAGFLLTRIRKGGQMVLFMF